VLGLQVGNSLLDFLSWWLRRIHPLRLLSQQLLVNEPIESAPTILVGDLTERPSLHERFKAHSIVPITLQDDVAIHRRDDSIDDIAGVRDAQDGRNEQKKIAKSAHQND
jgi:hypothetical protein